MIHFTIGNMFLQPYDVLVNPVNCVGVMGAGLALKFKAHFPKMFLDYRKICEMGTFMPGTIHIWLTDSVCILNVPTKRHWRDASLLDDVKTGVLLVAHYLRSLEPRRVAIPALGCGHGGLCWGDVKPLMEQAFEDLEHHISIFEPLEV